MDSIKRRRITVKYKRANPLFEQWISQWKEEAKNQGSNKERAYCRALASLKKCPIPLNSGKECKILKGFGDKLCQMLDNKLKEHEVNVIDDITNPKPVLANIPSISSEVGVTQPETSNELKENSEICSNKDKKQLFEEVILIDSDTEREPVEEQNSSAYPKPNKDSCETPHSVQMETNLENMPLSSKVIDPSIGKQPVTNHTDKQKRMKKQVSSTSIASQTNCQDEFLYFEPRSFEIVLYIDTGETTGSNVVVKNDPLLAELTKLPHVPAYEVKRLSVGDFVWICRHRVSKKELILPYIIERKRLDDFAKSIRDGRYHEQKFRLKRCGIQNKTYLVENYISKHLGLPLQTLLQAATNTAIQDGYHVKITSNLRHTAQYLSRFTKKLNEKFKDKAVMSCPKDSLDENQLNDDLFSLMTFKEFNETSLKNKATTVTELFVKMLVQVKGISVEKALAIVEVYPSPSLLLKAYLENEDVKPEKLLEQIQFGKYKKKIGPALSKIVSDLFTLERL
nr:crossover junction endonuclease MUS81 [Leptinotarsa decemlineata]